MPPINFCLDVISCNLGHVFKEDFHVYIGVKFSEKYSLKVHLDVLSQIQLLLILPFFLF